ncbi:GNAT family N-acetyltransferase [Olivibacter sp. SDN3]|uniref:GNAT family N-acetyltransferase n=1 Tax=Olivibacter sp. SDN3 TaxID=2764720 RepID=UPI0016515CD7|nr:GNAT family protein [Olivibacter sp. SDN3]QNL48235.1 GNAT family N-acetyltransferase [Olivibacter sp. SDN3]
MILSIDKALLLCEVQMSDAPAIFNIINAERIYLGKWLPFVAQTRVLSDTEAFVQFVVETPKELLKPVFSIYYEGELVGLIGLNNTDVPNKKTEIGYWLSQAYQKRGIMTRAVDRMTQFIFHELELNRIQINCAVDNHLSRAIPERLGFVMEGIQRDGELLGNQTFTDLVIYSKLYKDI